jgi:hypothetical protein
VICLRGQGSHIGAAPPHWGLAAGEIVVDSHRWPSAGMGGSMTGGATSSEREKGRGGCWAGRSTGPGKKRSGPGEGEKRARGWAARSSWAEQGKEGE